MRVSHIITRLIVGGAQENTIASVLGVRRRGQIDTRLIAGPTIGPEGSLAPTIELEPGVLTLVPTLVRPIHPWKDVLAFRQLVGLLREQEPDIVHTHSGKAGVLGRLAARRAAVPLILHTIHGPSFGNFQGPLANALFRGAERLAGRYTHHFVSVAHAMTQQYLAAGIGSPAQYTRIFSGFDLAPFLTATNDLSLRQRYGLAPDDFVVGKIARLFKLKGHLDLMAAAPGLVAQYPKIKFLLVGDGSWRARLEAQVHSLGLTKHFVFTGLVPPSAVASLVGIMDLLIHLSLREGLARALPQALAAGKPVIAYDCDGASEVCLEAETGFLVGPGRLDLLSSRILQLAKDPGLRTALGERGRALVREQFSVETMVENLEALYQRLWDEHAFGSVRRPKRAAPN